jgi:dihydrofolate reductase
VSGDVAAAVAELKREPGGDLAVGGAGVAASLIELGLVDELRPFVFPVVLGDGTPFLPPVATRLELELLGTRTFASRVVSLRYGLAGAAR